MKLKVILFVFVILFSITNSKDLGGKKYYSLSEVRELGIKVGKQGIEIKGIEIILKEDFLLIGDFKREFKNTFQIVNGEKYYNSFLIDELIGYEGEDTSIEKITSLSPGITEKVYALGLGDRLIGRTIYCNYPDEVKKIESVGSMLEPNFEKILVLGSDIVLMETHYKPGFVVKLKSVGIDYKIYTTPKSIESVYNDILSLGKILGVDIRARVIVASLKNKVTNYEESIAKLEKKKTVYYAVGAGRKEFTAGGDTFISDILISAGGINIASDKKGWNYSLEELIVKNPDYIIGGNEVIEKIRSDYKYNILNAVKNKRVIEVDKSVFELPGVRSIDEGVGTIYNILYD